MLDSHIRYWSVNEFSGGYQLAKRSTSLTFHSFVSICFHSFQFSWKTLWCADFASLNLQSHWPSLPWEAFFLFIAAMWLDQGKLPFYAGICAWATYYSKNYHNACTCTFRAVFQFTQNGQKNRYKLWLITESSLNEKTHHFRWTAKRLDGMRLRRTAPPHHTAYIQ